MERPRLKATVVVPPVGAGGHLGLILGPKAFDIRLRKGDLSQFAQLLSDLSGAYTCAEIAQRSGLSAASVSAVIERLRSFGLTYDYNSSPCHDNIDRFVFLRAFESFVPALRFDMFRHPLFPEIVRNERLFLATAAEYFHLIRDAESHIGIALQHAPERLRALISEYLNVERGHYISLEPALVSAFGGNFSLERLAPLAATESVMLKTRELARSDPLAWLACCSFSEVQALSSSARIPDHWSSSLRAVFDAFLDHAREDLDASHGSLFADALELTQDVLHPSAAERILTALHEYKHYFDNMNSEILRVYAQPGAPLPRLKQRLEDFLVTPEIQASSVTPNEY